MFCSCKWDSYRPHVFIGSTPIISVRATPPKAASRNLEGTDGEVGYPENGECTCARGAREFSAVPVLRCGTHCATPCSSVRAMSLHFRTPRAFP